MSMTREELEAIQERWENGWTHQSGADIHALITEVEESWQREAASYERECTMVAGLSSDLIQAREQAERAEARVEQLRAALELVDKHAEHDSLCLPEEEGCLCWKADVRNALAATKAQEGEPAVPLGLTWTGEEWMFNCGCALHLEDSNNSHAGAPHIHRCKQHGGDR